MSNNVNAIEYVSIPEDVCTNVERRFYEYQAALNILHWLTTFPDTQEQHLQTYFDSAEVKFAAMEMAKSQAIEDYPSTKGYQNYQFDFQNNCIKYMAERVDA